MFSCKSSYFRKKLSHYKKFISQLILVSWQD